MNPLLARQIQETLGSLPRDERLNALLDLVAETYSKLEGEQVRLVVELDRMGQELETLTRVVQDRLVATDRMQSVGTLAAGIAHEINNPLAYVASNVEFAAERLQQRAEADAETRAEIVAALEEAHEGSKRIARIVTNLRAFSHAPQESEARLDVMQVLSGAVKLVRHQIRHRARLVEDMTPVPLVMAVHSSLEQVFVNLLLNAAQAIPEGAAESNTVTVRLARRGDEVAIELEDTGAGMTEEVRAHIFDPFFTTRPFGVGSGLGLSICRTLVAQAGGRIDVWSELGKGSRFTVVLPLAT